LPGRPIGHAGRLRGVAVLDEQALAVDRKPDGSYYPSAYNVLKGFAALIRTTQKDVRAAEMEAPVRSLEANR
jgi:hypothetical protein